MRSKWIKEVRELLGSEEFRAWDRRYNQFKQEVDSTREFIVERAEAIRLASFKSESSSRHAEEILFRCGELEGHSDAAGAEYAEIDNDSFEFLSAFEEQRQVVRSKRVERDRVEEAIEKLRPETSELRARMKAGTISTAGLNRLKELGTEITDLEVQLDEIWLEFEAEDTKKDDYWVKVEGTWTKALRASMARAVYGFEARRLRSRTEEAYSEAGEGTAAVEALERELDTARERLASTERELVDHRNRAVADFQCIVVEDFLFWPREDDVKTAICVPLIDDRDHLNLQINRMEIYEVSRDQGLDFVVPLPVGDTGSQEDPRLEQFFASPGA